MYALYVILGLVVLLVIYAISAYNMMIIKRNHCEESNAAIDAHLQKRYDLIPNLVSIVKSYAAYEKETLENIIKARSLAMSSKSFEEKDKANLGLSGALKSLFAVAESYPELKANENFLSLQNELSEVEDELTRVRKFYNAVVKEFNNTIEIFPNSIFAGIFGFKRKPYVTIEESVRSNVKVQL